MEKRNFNIMVTSIIIVMIIFWLSLYAFIILDVDPFQNIKNLLGDDEAVVTIKGNVNRELELTVSEFKSDKYIQVEDETFHFINAIGREYDVVYSGASLWSILEEENVLGLGASTFLFIGGDGYYAESPLPLSLAETYPNQIILAYEEDGEPLFLDGPIRSVIDYELIPDKATTHYSIQNLKTILIE